MVNFDIWMVGGGEAEDYVSYFNGDENRQLPYISVHKTHQMSKATIKKSYDPYKASDAYMDKK